jgi:hypothetical protein
VKPFSTTRLVSGILVSLLACGSAVAQYGGSATPSYGSGAKVAAGVGAAAAGTGILYLALRNKGSVTGCVQGGEDVLNIVDRKNHQTYSLVAGAADLKAGQLVELKGKKSKDSKGTQIFHVSKVVRNLGGCSTESLASLSHSR